MKIEIVSVRSIPKANMTAAMKAFMELCKTKTIGVISGANRNDATKMYTIRRKLNLKAEIHYVAAANAITIIPTTARKQKFVLHGAKMFRSNK